MENGNVMRFLMHSTISDIQCIYMVGMAILSEHMRTAAQVLINGTKAHSYSATPLRIQKCLEQKENVEIKESIAFVQGTGLNIVIESYGLGVDPEEFREGFFYWCDFQRRKKQSKSA